MNSQYAPANSDLTGHDKIYDNAYLRKRVNCLGSGLLLCFLVGGAGLGISIISLLKYEGASRMLPEFSANQTMLVANLKDQLGKLQQQIESLKKEISSAGGQSFRTMILNSSADRKEDGRILDISSTDLNLPDLRHEDHFDHSGNEDYTDLSNNKDHLDHASHGHHHDHMMTGEDHMTLADKDGPHLSPEAGTPSVNELLCGDDPDLCLPSSGVEVGSGEEESYDRFSIIKPLDGFYFYDGSGHSEESVGEEDSVEGSGDCIQFARPVCPIGFNVCYTKAPCPIPVCC